MLKLMQIVIGLFKGNLKRPTRVHQYYTKTIQCDFLLNKFIPSSKKRVIFCQFSKNFLWKFFFLKIIWNVPKKLSLIVFHPTGPRAADRPWQRQPGGGAGPGRPQLRLRRDPEARRSAQPACEGAKWWVLQDADVRGVSGGPSIGPPWCRETPVSRTAMSLSVTFFLSGN